MHTRDYYEIIKCLSERYCLHEQYILFVNNIADWCKKNGIPENDDERPFKLVSKGENGCKLLIKEYISDTTVKERMNALSIRSQLKNVAFDRSELLNSDEKKLSYLFLSEFVSTLGDTQDEWLADDWTFNQMEEMGFFTK